MHFNYADIFGVESLSLNKHFAKPINNIEHCDSKLRLAIPEQLAADLDKAIESLDMIKSYDLLAQDNKSYTLTVEETINICVSSNGLTPQDKKQLWLALCNT